MREDISLDLGCSYDEQKAPHAVLAPDEEDSLFMQLEGGLFETALPSSPPARVSSFFLPRDRKHDGRNAPNQSMDSDQFLWSEGNVVTPATVSS